MSGDVTGDVTGGAGLVLPEVPTVDRSLLDEHRSARVDLRDRIDALPAPVAAVLRWSQRRRLVESAANVFVDDRPLLVPPRRRHLGTSIGARVRAADVGIRHVDARLEMLRLGHVDRPIGVETPYVLNAIAESHGSARDETNPGLIRLGASGFDATQTSYIPPDGAVCGPLLDGCVDVANDESLEAVVRAAWLAATVLAVHPFVDGNGRTARLLFQLVAGSDPELRTDWGSLEQWSIARTSYVAALKASQAPSITRYDGRRLRPGEFVDFAVRAATVGARLVGERADWTEVRWSQIDATDADDDDELRMVELAVTAASSSSVDELVDLVADPLCTDVVRSLVERRRLRWDQRGLLRPA